MTLFQMKTLLVGLTEIRNRYLKIKEIEGIMFYFSKFQEKSVFISDTIPQLT